VAENGKAFPLASEKVVLGRNSASKNIQNDIDLTDLDTKKIISRRHAMVACEEGRHVLYDLNSRNGTYLNGIRIPSDQSQLLKAGDVIEFGQGGVKLTFG
jgi:pSer/pThr/pTyr-binding forkhead associated (FHA) protein